MSRRLAVALVLASLGCTSYRTSAPLPAPETEVRVSFVSPRDITAQMPTGEPTVLRNVMELRGKVIRAQLDTRVDSIRILLGQARGPTGPVPGVVSGTVATVPREMFVRVEQRQLDAPKTLRRTAYVIGAVLVAGLALLALALGAASEGY